MSSSEHDAYLARRQAIAAGKRLIVENEPTNMTEQNPGINSFRYSLFY